MLNALATKIEELKEENENLAYENKKMAEFIKYIGISEEELTNIIIHSDQSQWSLLIQ